MKQTEVAAVGAKVRGTPAADGVRAMSRAFDFGQPVGLCRRPHDKTRRSAARAVDTYLVTRNWLFHRACPEIRQTLSVESAVKLPAGNRQAPSVTSASPASGGPRHRNWSHAVGPIAAPGIGRPDRPNGSDTVGPIRVPGTCPPPAAIGREETAMAEHITVSVDPDVADVYRSASDDDRRKLDLLINLRLREVTAPGSSLRTLLLEISRDARRRGLTPEILQSILDEK